jgi:hypothetical protein
MKLLATVKGWFARASSESTMLIALLRASRAHGRNAFYWGLVNLLGGLMPLWATLFVRAIYGRPPNTEAFVIRGDVVLYAAAFLAPVIYQVTVRIKKEASVLGVGAVIVAVSALLLSAITYVVVNPEFAPGGTPQAALNRPFVSSVSYALLLLAFGLSMVVFLNEQQLEYEELTGVEKIGQEALSAKVEELKPEPARTSPLPAPPEIDEATLQETLSEKFHEEENGQQ